MLIGPTMPHCAASGAPMRSIAIITITTGAKVVSVALSSDSHSTASGTTTADAGRRMNSCAIANRQATLVAAPVRRSAPMRRTTSPLATRYTAYDSALANTSAAPSATLLPSKRNS